MLIELWLRYSQFVQEILDAGKKLFFHSLSYSISARTGPESMFFHFTLRYQKKRYEDLSLSYFYVIAMWYENIVTKIFFFWGGG